MAKKCREDEICCLFIFDHTVLKKEGDDLKDAILYFYPRTVSADNQCALVGKMIGISDFMMGTLPKSPPRIMKLQTEKFAMKRTECYSIGLGSNLSVADNFLVAHLDFVWETFTFFQGGMSAVKQRHRNQEFLLELGKIWDSYMPICHFYGDMLAQAFQLLPTVCLTKSDGNLFLHASHTLQRCHRQDGVLGGVLLYSSKVICTQLSPDLTRRLLLLKPKQTHLPCIPYKVDFEKPDSVRLLKVFIPESEYKQINLRKTGSLKHCTSETRRSHSLSVSQLNNDVFTPSETNLTTLPTVHCRTAATKTSPGFVERNPPNFPEHQAPSLFHDESPLNVTESEQMLNTNSAVNSNISKDEISDKNMDIIHPLKGHSFEEGEKFRTVNGLSISLIKNQSLEEYQLSQSIEDQAKSCEQSEGHTVTNENQTKSCEQIEGHNMTNENQVKSHEQSEGHTVTNENQEKSHEQSEGHTVTNENEECLDPSNEVLASHEHIPITVCSAPDNTVRDLNSLSVDVKSVNSSDDIYTQLNDINVTDQIAIEVDNHIEHVDPSLDKSHQTNIAIPCEQNIDNSKPETDSQSSSVDPEICTNPDDSQDGVDGEHKTEEITNSDCDNTVDKTNEKDSVDVIKLDDSQDVEHKTEEIVNSDCDNTIDKTNEKDVCHHSSHVDRIASDNESSAAPVLTEVDQTPQSPNTSGSASSHSPSSKDNSFEERCIATSGGSLTSLSEERVHSCKESLHFSLSTEPRSSVESEEVSSLKQEKSLPAHRASETCSEIPHSSSQRQTIGEKWVPAADGLVDLVLYIQGHSDMMLLLLLDNRCKCDYALIHNLWKFSLPNLGELDFQVKECLDRQTREQAQPNTEIYCYLQNDSFSKSLIGNVMDSVTGSSHEFVSTAAKIHHSFQESDTLTDALFCSHKASVYAHRSVNHETFFQMNNPQSSTGGFPNPKDVTFTLDQVARKKLQADHDISLL